MNGDFEKGLAFGREAERMIADLLRRRGFYVIPSYDYSGDDDNKAPKMEGIESAYVVPDLDAAANGLRAWYEVKRYQQTARFRKWQNRWVHGIPGRLMDHYLKVQSITGCPVYLVVCEDWTAGKVYSDERLPDPEILFGKLDEIEKHDCSCPMCGRFAPQYCQAKIKRGIYFSRDSFSAFAQWSEVNSSILKGAA